jgi:hypothetical protein
MPAEIHASHAEQLRRVRADAASLCQVVAAADLPDGLILIDLGSPSSDLQGITIGNGYGLARWAGDHMGRQAVGVAVSRMLETCRQHKCTECLQPMVESVALHEVAHVIWSQDTPSQEVVEQVMASLEESTRPNANPQRRAKDHPVHWAATLTVLADRAMAFRPRSADLLAVCVSTDLEAYGYSHAALRRLLSTVPARSSLREVLDPSTVLSRSLLAAQMQHDRPLSATATTQHVAAAAACTSLR